MPASLYEPPCSCNGSRIPAHNKLPRLATRSIELVQHHATPNRHGTSEILATYTERLRERDVAKVMRPEKERTLGGGATEEVVSCGFDRELEIVP